jgi:hypothetical protein
MWLSDVIVRHLLDTGRVDERRSGKREFLIITVHEKPRISPSQQKEK